MIRFAEITNQNVWKICHLEVEDFQKDFVADNASSLIEAFATRNEGNVALPFAIYDGDTPVGFIMIGKGTVGNEEESELVAENYCIWRLMIDRHHQGKGYGKEAVLTALQMMRDDAFGLGRSKYCWLSYEPENSKGKELYRRLGFVENGEMCDDEVVAVYTF